MPGTVITTSPDIALLDSKIVADLCIGKFYVDISPSIYIGSGKDNVLGANVKIVNPFGVVVKDYGTNYEIAPALSGGMDAVISFNIPTMASNYQYGKYTITVELYDQNNTRYTVTKIVSLCEPDKKNKTRSYGTLSASVKGDCVNGKVYIIVDTPPNYNGRIYESRGLDLTIDYPTASGESPEETSIGSISLQLYEGVYKLTGTDCVTYNFGDNVFVKINYKIRLEKNIRCLIDECCVFAKLAELNLQLKNGCPPSEQERISAIVVDALLLLKTIQLAATCGEDPSDYITDLEKLIGCTCTCNCAEGTPIINTSPAKDFSIIGCGFEKLTIGLTDTYTIYNYEYVVGVVENGGVLVVSAATVDGCTKTQTIEFSITAAYNQIKTLITADTSYWQSLINSILNSGNITAFQSVLVAISNCCSCSASISGVSASQSGANVILTWTGTDEFSTDIYVDGIFLGNVLAGVDTFTVVGGADGATHNYALLPKCSNNKYGTSANGTFAYLGCPSITPPVVSSNNVNGVECPYDLTSLESTPPAGITVEWHTANNTNASSLVPDATQVSSGVYYAFAKDADGCYSTATTVTLICAEATSCTAPQNLLVAASVGGFLASFQSAAFPPPASSYTVKRRLYADPDIDGSYTTIGTPTWNAGTSRWEILDATAVNNVLYVYKAISNCGGSPPTTPYTTYTFANIDCPSLTLTPDDDSVGYSFAPSGGGITKYEVKIYDATGTTLIHTDTHLPAFSNPTTGTFTYLSAGTTYKVRITVFIGTYSVDCAFSTTTTTTQNYRLNASLGLAIASVTGSGIPSLGSTGTNGSLQGHQTGMSGNYSVTITGTPGITTKVTGYKNGVVQDCEAVPSAGTYVLAITALESDAVIISIESGVC
jgi:hypothetical protein